MSILIHSFCNFFGSFYFDTILNTQKYKSSSKNCHVPLQDSHFVPFIFLSLHTCPHTCTCIICILVCIYLIALFLLDHLRAVADIRPIYFWIFPCTFSCDQEFWNCAVVLRTSYKTIVQFSKLRNLVLIQYYLIYSPYSSFVSWPNSLCSYFQYVGLSCPKSSMSGTVTQLFFVFHEFDIFQVYINQLLLKCPQIWVCLMFLCD